MGSRGAGFPHTDQIFAVSAGGQATMSPQGAAGELLSLANLLFSEAVKDLKKRTELRYLSFRRVRTPPHCDLCCISTQLHTWPWPAMMACPGTSTSLFVIFALT